MRYFPVSGRITIRFLLAMGVLTAALFGDSMETFTQTVGAFDGPFQSCIVVSSGDTSCPSSVDFTMPQFDPALGTLNSISWEFTAGERVFIDVDNCTTGFEAPEINYSYTITAGDTILGKSGQNAQSGTGTEGTHCAGVFDPFYANAFSISGSVSDKNLFIGTGTVNIPVTSFISGSVDTDRLVGVGFFSEEEFDTLDLSYTYTSAAPEPSLGIVLALGVVGMAGWHRCRNLCSCPALFLGKRSDKLAFGRNANL
jgi:hypothetical protein